MDVSLSAYKKWFKKRVPETDHLLLPGDLINTKYYGPAIVVKVSKCVNYGLWEAQLYLLNKQIMDRHYSVHYVTIKRIVSIKQNGSLKEFSGKDDLGIMDELQKAYGRPVRRQRDMI